MNGHNMGRVGEGRATYAIIIQSENTASLLSVSSPFFVFLRIYENVSGPVLPDEVVFSKTIHFTARKAEGSAHNLENEASIFLTGVVD